MSKSGGTPSSPWRISPDRGNRAPDPGPSGRPVHQHPVQGSDRSRTRGDPLAIEALEDPEFYVREKAAEAMGRIGGTGAVESLLAAYSDRDSDVKRRITRALIDIGPPAEEQVKKAARSPDPNIREAAEEVLREIEARKKRRE
ncbi:MAG: HEAT repeat domain-containing protein [Methanoregulaceae archaeon]|jgi:hypothetical protein|nr:HEAT repeat domain-containing protein [Methanoregulaceae archaeon]